jgi:hypothetical protein
MLLAQVSWCGHVQIAAANSEPLKAPGVWSEQWSDDGKVYYFNKYLNISKWTITDEERQLLVPNLDPYNNHLFMPLADFIHQPIAQELLHNGATFQVGVALLGCLLRRQ